jgi:hypothetical protein
VDADDSPPFIRMATPMASATSCRLAPATAAPRACEAMQPSQCSATAMAKAISSFVLTSSAPGLNEAR